MHVSPAIEPMLTMVPWPCLAMTGTTASVSRRTANTFVSYTSLTDFRGWSIRGPASRRKAKRNQRTPGTPSSPCSVTWARDPGVVHKDVDLALPLNDVLHDRGDALVTVHVERKPLDRAVRKVRDSLRATRRGVHGAALARELLAAA